MPLSLSSNSSQTVPTFPLWLSTLPLWYNTKENLGETAKKCEEPDDKNPHFLYSPNSGFDEALV